MAIQDILDTFIQDISNLKTNVGDIQTHKRTKSFRVLEPFFRELQGSMVVYEHTEGRRVHCHALVNGGPNTTTMKARLVKLCGKWKKEDWAFMTKYRTEEGSRDVNDTLITYMSKGKLAPSYVVGYTEESIERFRSAWVEYEKPKKPTHADLCDEVIRRLGVQLHPHADTSILAEVVRVLQHHRMVVGRYKMRDMCDTVKAWLDPPRFVAEMANSALLSFPLRREYNPNAD